MTAAASWRAELGLVFVSFVWGATFVLVKSALNDVSAVLFLALRFSLAAVLLGLLASLRGQWRDRFGWRALGGGALTGTVLYAGYLLQTLGLRQTTPALSGFITGLYIVLVPLMAGLVLRRVPRVSEWSGVALAALGMGLMSLQATRETLQIGPGELLTTGCAVAFAIHILLLDRFSKVTSTDLLSFLQIASCAGIASLTFFWVEPVVIRWTAAVLIAVLVTAIFAT
ncbi:MAG TPA: DMT family transporter, partial [Bryobacteraceae bacterium]|nr:DMT family transporter [Bryobacteraceae bacterium]